MGTRPKEVNRFRGRPTGSAPVPGLPGPRSRCAGFGVPTPPATSPRRPIPRSPPPKSRSRVRPRARRSPAGRRDRPRPAARRRGRARTTGPGGPGIREKATLHESRATADASDRSACRPRAQSAASAAGGWRWAATWRAETSPARRTTTSSPLLTTNSASRSRPRPSNTRTRVPLLKRSTRRTWWASAAPSRTTSPARPPRSGW